MKDPTPLYHRVYLVLREQILDRKFDPTNSMPSENELASAFNVSRVTLRKTMERLEREGLVLRQRGRGTFAVPPASQTTVQADIGGLVKNLLAMGLRTKVKVLEFDYVKTPPDAAADMGVEPGTVAQRAVRLRSYENRPFSYAETYVREDIGRTFTAEEMATIPLLRLFEMAGVKIADAQQRVTARAADYHVGDLLGVEVGSPLLCIKRVVRDETGSAVERIRALYRPDVYEFELNLTLGRGPDGTLW